MDFKQIQDWEEHVISDSKLQYHTFIELARNAVLCVRPIVGDYWAKLKVAPSKGWLLPLCHTATIKKEFTQKNVLTASLQL